MSSLLERIAIGALSAVGAAFVWGILNSTFYGWREGWILSVPLAAGYAVLLTSWFALPLGAVLGGVMPGIVSRCSRREAFVRGALLGLCTAVTAALLTSVFEEWPYISGRATIVNHEALWRVIAHRFLLNLVTMTLVCTVWVGAWAARWSGRCTTSNPAA